MHCRKEDLSLKNSLAKKVKAYSKNCQIPLPKSNDDLDDKLLEDLKDREKQRVMIEDDVLDELKIYDLTVVADYWKKYVKKMLGILVTQDTNNEKYDEKLIDGRIPSCFHVNYIMNKSNPVSFFLLNII